MMIATSVPAPKPCMGHSLGRNKKEKLLADGLSEPRINKQYKIDTRIQVEESIMQRADLIITSTQQE
ncbi:MAG: hypothetical protein U9P36_09495, partial [Thermodesulfobacteriota bacterium]|nr:hypothetical protein [Thermodesulfobacteriota bacterium]